MADLENSSDDARNADEAPDYHLFTGPHGDCEAAGEHSHVPVSPAVVELPDDVGQAAADQALATAVNRFADHHPGSVCVDCLTAVYQAGALAAAEAATDEIARVHAEAVAELDGNAAVRELRELWQRALEREGNLASAVADVIWKATQFGSTEDGDTFAYIVPKGCMHRLVGVAQQNGAHVPVAFRNSAEPISEEDAVAEAVAAERQRIAAVLNGSDLFAAEAPHNAAAWQLRADLLAAGSVPVATPPPTRLPGEPSLRAVVAEHASDQLPVPGQEAGHG